MRNIALTPGNLILKRSIDILGAVVLLFVTFPLMCITAIVVYFSLGLPIFFCQERTGLRGKRFLLLKFRTMHKIDPTRNRITDQTRLNRVGYFLRRWSLDELPTLVNVLLNQMSLVGPRPLLLQYLSQYSEEQARRHDMKPGITGWAQVNGRNSISWEKKMTLDLWYIDHWNLFLDFKIAFATIREVWIGTGIRAADHATMPPFSQHSQGHTL